MARFGTLGTQYLDDAGDPLSGGLIYFYEPGTTTTKVTYSDSALTTPNTQPAVLDAAGRQGNIFFSDLAKAVLKTSAEVTIETRDPVGDSAAAGTPYADWDSAFTYSEGDIATGSDGLRYISIANSNVGNDPVSSATEWSIVPIIRVWNTNETYTASNYVLGTDGMLYKSAQASNQGNTPVGDDGTWWTRHTLDEPTINDATASGGTYTGITLDGASIVNGWTEETFISSGTGDDFDVANGTIWKYTMTANSTFTESLVDGNVIELHLLGGDLYTFTPPAGEWINDTAPTLTAYDVIIIKQVASQLIYQYVGGIVL